MATKIKLAIHKIINKECEFQFKDFTYKIAFRNTRAKQYHILSDFLFK